MTILSAESETTGHRREGPSEVTGQDAESTTAFEQRGGR